MEPASTLASNDRLASDLEKTVLSICSTINSEARAANTKGQSRLSYEITKTFDLSFPDPQISRTYVYGMIIEELERQKYIDVTITPMNGNKVFIEFGWKRDYDEAELQRYQRLVESRTRKKLLG